MPIRMDGGGSGSIGLDAWRALAAKNQAPPGQLLRKEYLPDEIKEVEGRERTIRFVISTGSVDRDRDTIAPAGWKFDAFKKNPVVLWAHDYRKLPIAKAVEIEVRDDKLVATAEFATADMNPLAESVYRMLKGGFLRATSVGFEPKRHVYNEDRRGVDFIEQELLEFSVVPVPANPEALMEAAAKGIDIGPVLKWAKDVLASAIRDRKAYRGYQEFGFTTPARGATSPEHVHDYSLWLEAKEDGRLVFHGGSAYQVANHAHRITEESLARGEVESSDGHIHRLMPAQEFRALLDRIAKGDHDECPMGEQCPMRGKATKPRVVPPENGQCPAGYHMGDDGMCHEKTLRRQAVTRDNPWSHLLYASKQDGFEIQSVLFPKAKWDSADACRAWLKDHDFKSGDLDEGGDHYRFRQRDPGDFERIRTICLAPGRDTPIDDCRVKAVGGPLKAASPEEAVLMIEDGPEVELFGVDPETVKEAWAEVLGGYAASAIGALKGRVD